MLSAEYRVDSYRPRKVGQYRHGLAHCVGYETKKAIYLCHRFARAKAIFTVALLFADCVFEAPAVKNPLKEQENAEKHVAKG